MKLLKTIRVFSSLFVLSIVFATLLSVHFSLSGKADSGTEIVSGTVTSQDDNGIADVSVTATDPGGTTVDYGPVTSDDNGNYSLDVEAGSYDFHYVPASGSNFSPIIDSDVTVNENQTINIQLPPTYTFSGTLTDSNGDPLSGVTIALNSASSGQGVGNTTTDSNGQFSISAVSGTYNIEVKDESTLVDNMTAFDFVQSGGAINLTSGDVTQNLQLNTAAVHVTVEDANGNPIPNASVTEASGSGSTSLYPNDPGEESEGTLLSRGTTDANGTVELGSIVGQTYGANPSSTYPNICAYISSTTVCLPSQLTISGNADVIIAEPRATYTFSGTLTDSNGDPLSGVTIALNSASSGQGVGNTTTDSNGQFSISAVSGTYNIEVKDESTLVDNMTAFDFVQSGGAINLTSGDVTQNLQLNTAAVHVTVEDANGNPIPNASVTEASGSGSTSLYPNDPGEESEGTLLSRGTTDANGTVELGSIVGQTYGANPSSTYPNICAYISSTTVCLPSQLTISGNADVIIQEAPSTPTPPTNLQIPSPTTAPALTWTAVTGATSYNIYANGSLIGNTTTTSYTDSSPTIGTDSYYVTALNSAGESGPSNIVNVTVTSPTTVPTITSASSVQFDARAVSSFTVTTTGSPTPSITESGSLPTGITFTDNGNGTATLAGQASPTNNGYYFITLTATNSTGTTTQNFILTINDAQTTPTIISTNTLTESYGVPFSFTVDTTGNPLPNITKVSGSGSLPAGVTLKDNNDGTATLSGELANASDSGTYTFTIQAKNSNGTATQPFTLTITKTPVISNIPTKTATVGATYSQTITASGDPTPSLSVTNLPSGLSFTDNGNGTGTISGTPNVGSGKSYTITVTATNTEGSTTESFTMKVNEAPTITSANNATATIGSSFNFQVTSTGYPNPSFNETGTLPKGITFTNSTGTFSGTPAAGTAGTYNVTVTAKNSQGTDTQGFGLRVE